MVGPKDFTDYRVAIYGSGLKTETEVHIRCLPKAKKPKVYREISCLEPKETPGGYQIILPYEAEINAIKFNGYKYLFESQRNRVYRTKKAAWVKWKPRDPLGTLKEFFRSKKIGYLIYQEPCDHKCSQCPDKDKDDPCPSEEVEAFHHSIIHQPSGRLLSEPPHFVVYGGKLRPSDVETTTPYMLKTRIENRFYRQQYGSFSFGAKKMFGGKKLIYIAIAAVAITLGIVLYFSGALGV